MKASELTPGMRVRLCEAPDEGFPREVVTIVAAAPRDMVIARDRHGDLLEFEASQIEVVL